MYNVYLKYHNLACYIIIIMYVPTICLGQPFVSASCKIYLYDVGWCSVIATYIAFQLDLFSGVRLLRSPSAIPRGLLCRSLVLAVSTLSFLIARVRLMKGGPDIFTV